MPFAAQVITSALLSNAFNIALEVSSPQCIRSHGIKLQREFIPIHLPLKVLVCRSLRVLSFVFKSTPPTPSLRVVPIPGTRVGQAPTGLPNFW